jgi:4,5-DOPA dioxygenase extradiol
MSSSRQPVLFVGHGSPMNAIEDNTWSRAFRALAATLPRPRAVLAVSAHWYVEGTFTTANAHPETIHDFGGFPRALHEVQYPAPGDAALARRAVELVGPGKASLSNDWGLDHGTWSVLVHLLPAADVPVVQLSIDGDLGAEEHLALGRALRPLRDEGVLVMASGNITHNLRAAFTAMHHGDRTTPAWAKTFDERITAAITQRDLTTLSHALEGPEGRMSHPSPDHYLPLLYAMGATDEADAVSFPITGFDLGSLSMRSVRWGSSQ